MIIGTDDRVKHDLTADRAHERWGNVIHGDCFDGAFDTEGMSCEAQGGVYQGMCVGRNQLNIHSLPQIPQLSHGRLFQKQNSLIKKS